MPYGFLADLILAVHALVPLFIAGGLVAIGVGAWRGWGWVRGRRWRMAHAGLMGVVLAQALLGRLCPLTHWEHDLRIKAGQASYGEPESFIAVWVGRLLYLDLPPTFFVILYLAVAFLIGLAWWRVPPRWSPSR
jgi:hypothetical protein